ncbi:alpha-L-fucosidase [Pedobacter metabolipauper]|uniref:alpha-L-fucosidase n=1 Tax=Pedobacter metabolipauper TaxID=425513 RepID=A0A4R6SVI6_9SPHI|nr:alpha-L-fucosidase [Pedobacter metabolipauper]TDQ09878.1 alpha-L-fucosidase [Pedobacter metabolipauper]
MKQKHGILLLLVLLTNTFAFGQHDPKALKEWQEQKYSMFIHFGVYSVLGGVWNGKPATRNVSEQIQAHAGIYTDEYERIAKTFNPEKWNPDSIVSLAKKAGMRSIVITSKHHDGFCMFKTNTTDFNVVDFSPYKRDLLKELSEACKRGGLRFGLYFSLIDWHYPQASPISGSNSDYITPEHVAYNKKQITELLTNYGPVSELWFDMGSQSSKESEELRDLVHKLQPNCMIGSRIGNDMGDFNVMGDNQEPDYVIGVPWQSPASFFDETWGYRSFQKRGKEEDKVREKLTSLIQVVSRGGNFLLNIGPKGDGTVVDFETSVLTTIGKWLERNKEAIYSTDPDPFHISFKWGSLTSRPNKIYLHLLKRPEGDVITLPGLTGKIKSVSVLAENKKVKYSQNAAGVTITVPAGLNIENEFKVVAIEFVNGFQVPPANIIQAGTNAVVLNGHNAFKHYSNSGIDYGNRYQSTVKESWTINPTQTGTLTPVIAYTNEEKGKTIDLEINRKVTALSLTGGDAEKLKNDPAAITWGPLYQSGSFYSGVGGVHGNLSQISIDKPWPNAKSPLWEKKTDWKNNETYEVNADKNSATYLLQEISSESDQSCLVGITSGDGVTVSLNGIILAEHNNPFKERSLKDVVLLPLKKGINKLVVKYYNGFQKSSVIGIANDVEQVMYHKALKPISVEKGKYYPVSWQLHKPFSPHTTLGLPNLSLELRK